MQGHSHMNPGEFAVIFPIFFVALWCGIVFLISQISGWATLARRFRLNFPFTGQIWTWQSARMRWSCNYGSCLKVGADPTGLYLSTLILFGIGHPAPLMPWPEVTVCRRWKILFFRYVELRLGREEQIPFQISQRLADRLRPAAGTSWPVEPIS